MLFVLIIVFRVEMGLPSAQVLQRFGIASTLVGKHCIGIFGEAVQRQQQQHSVSKLSRDKF